MISFFLLFCVSVSWAQTPLGTDFTYQGSLSSPGMPEVTTADFQFTLHDAPSSGSQVGAMLPKDNVALNKGAFTLSLDFGAAAFSGDARWLQIAVRSPAGLGGFTTLTPRQPLTAAPFALQTRGLVVDSAGQVGVGSTAPAARLEVRGNSDTSPNTGTPIARFSRGNGNNFIAMFADSGGNYIVADDPNVNQKDLRLQTRNNKNILLEPNGTGNVGIGAPSPSAKLEVHGDIRLGPNGQLRAPGAEENLRIIRGEIFSSGVVFQGAGFTCEHLSLGRYKITFDTPFAGPPSITATVVLSIGIVVIEERAPDAVILQVFGYNDTFFFFENRGFQFIAAGAR